MTNVEISVVVPVYRAEDCLNALQERLSAVLQALNVSYELVLVEDRGPDNSWQVLQQLAKNDPHVKAYRLSRNFGQHAAITAGLEQATGNWIVVMDCDLQDPPEVLPQLYAKAREGHDVVFARRKQKQHTWFRRIAALLYFKILNLVADQAIDGDYGSFSIISNKVKNAYLSVKDNNRHYLLILHWLGFTHTCIEYDHAQRFSGESSYTLRGLIGHALEGMFFQTTKLLRWIVYLGFACSTAGILIAAFLVYHYLIHSSIPGWTSLAVLVLISSGMILMALGVVGLYIGQVFEQVQGRPLYVIDESCRVLSGEESETVSESNYGTQVC